MGGGISASWASICAIQRIIPEGRLLHSRFVLGGMFGVPWILVVPASRRAELSMYMFRMTIFNLVSVYKHIYGAKGMRYVWGGHSVTSRLWNTFFANGL